MKKPILVTVISVFFSLSMAGASFAAVSHKVKNGDNLYTIAKKHQVSVESLKTNNGLKTHNLKLGQTIVIEKDQKESVKKSVTKTTKNVRVARNIKNVRVARSGHTRHKQVEVVPEETQNDGEFIEYKVKKGDTVDRVAVKFGIDKDDIVESNNNLGKSLSPGRVLLIPRSAETEKEDDYVDLSVWTQKTWKSREERYMLVKVAKSFMGAPYRYGGDSVRGLDCSAFVKKIYDIFDVQLPRSARDQYKVGPKIPKEDLAVGDLVFFRTKRFVKYATHVGIYIGDGNFIHSSSAHDKIGVRVDSLNSDFYAKTFLGATRVKKSSEDNQEALKNSNIPFDYNYNS